MKRSVLDDFALRYHLDERAAAAALDLTGARPGHAAWLRFALRLLHGSGIASLAAGGIFFVAANWQRFAFMGRFALIEAWLLACVAVALWRPPPDRIGRSAVLVAVVATGALLALFGQSYQTGADIYELFLVWSLIALPFALGGRWAATWAAWWIVLNVGIALFCGWLGPDHFMWGWLERWGADKPSMLTLPFAANLAGAGLFAWLRDTRFAEHSSRWLARMLMTFAFGYGTIASIMAIAGDAAWRGQAMTANETSVVLVFALASIAVAGAALWRKRDVFPIALVVASWIAVTTVALVRALKFDDIGAFFLVALWLIVTSTAAAFALMKWVRAWRIEEDPVEATAA